MFDYPSVAEVARHVHQLLAPDAAAALGPSLLAKQLASEPAWDDQKALIQVSIASRLPEPAQAEQAASVQAASPGMVCDAITAVPAMRWDLEDGKPGKVRSLYQKPSLLLSKMPECLGALQRMLQTDSRAGAKDTLCTLHSAASKAVYH